MASYFEVVEVAGISTESISDAVKSALTEFGKDNNIAWFEVIEQRGRMTQGNEIEFQVKVKIGTKK